MHLSIGGLSGVLEGELVRALCGYQGRFTSMDGIVVDLDASNMSFFADSTNRYMNFGVRVPLFESEHKASQKTKVGLVDSDFEVRVIEEEDLPDPKMKDIIGLPGLFTKVRLLTKEAIARFNAGLLRPISIGVDVAGYQFPPGTIHELSAVGVSAVPGAQLYRLGVGSMAYKEEIMKAIALSRDPNALETQTAEIKTLFQGLIRLAKGNDAAAVETAVDELVVGLTAGSRTLAEAAAEDEEDEDEDEDEEGDEEFDEEELTGDAEPSPELVKLKADVKRLSAQLAQSSAENQLSQLYLSVSQKAQKLFEEGYLTPIAYEDFQSSSTEPKALHLRFGSAKGGIASAITELTKKSNALDALKAYGTPVRMGNRVDGFDPPSADDGTRKEVKTFLDERPVKQPSYR